MNYREQTNDAYIEKIREISSELPDFCRPFFSSKKQTYERRSTYAYAMDLKVFFEYIVQTNPIFKGKSIKEIPIEIFNSLNYHDINDYLDFLEKYTLDGIERRNSDSGKRRKFASLQTFCKFLKQKGYIENNPIEGAERPTLHKKDIITLTTDEKKELFFSISSGYGMRTFQDAINAYCRTRDYAILMLFLGTGIRVSELVGLDIEDIDFKENMIHIIRKGGKEGHVYFDAQVKKALMDYYSPTSDNIGTRGAFKAPAEERAFFISRKRNRLSVRSVQSMIEKYKELAFGQNYKKKITCHSMRKTYGTELYRQKGDIKLISDVLGHSSIATTQAYYAGTSEERRKEAAIRVL